jgi:hypothetical protein
MLVANQNSLVVLGENAHPLETDIGVILLV